MKVSKKQLEQYNHKFNELKELSDKIEKLLNVEDVIVSDTVKYSSPRFGYHESLLTITGYSNDKSKKLDKLRGIWNSKAKKLQDELLAIEKFIAGIDDSEVSQIIRYKYLDNYTWNKVATLVYKYPCGDRARKTLERYLN